MSYNTDAATLNGLPGSSYNGGTVSAPPANKTAAYTALSSDTVILCDTTGAAFTITLPASPTAGKVYYIKKVAVSNTLSIAPAGGVMIDGVPVQTLTTINSAYQIVFSGSATAYYIL